MAKPSSGLDPLSWTPEELGRKESTKAGQVQRLLKNYFGAIWTQDRFADDFYERNDESLRRHIDATVAPNRSPAEFFNRLGQKRTQG